MNHAMNLEPLDDLGGQSAQKVDTPLPADLSSAGAEGAQVLALEQAQPLSVTPREINAHLARILQSYDDLTARFAHNKLTIDAELTRLRDIGGEVSGQILQLHAVLQQQDGALASHVAQTADQISDVKSGVQASLVHTEARLDERLVSLSHRVDADVKRLGEGMGSIEEMLVAQAGIVRAQATRLNQFDVTYELLDTATRGNRKRIEAVREETEKQHAIAIAQVQGLDALQRAQYAEFDEVRQTVKGLQVEAQRLDDAIHTVSTDLETHAEATGRTFKRTHLAVAALLLLTLSGFALVKWAPALAPVSTTQAIARSDQRIAALEPLVAGMPILQEKSAEQDGKIVQTSGQVEALERRVTGLTHSLLALRGMVLDASVQAGVVLPSGRPLLDRQWLLQQSPKAFTVQLVGVGSREEMRSYLAQYAASLDDKSLAFTVTQRDQRDRYNLFYGVFDSLDQARVAVDALPPALHAYKPWVRKLGAVQDTVQ